MARRTVEVRREEILRATVDEVVKRGFAHTRVADVAAALGISTGLVFYHFESKDALLSDGLRVRRRARPRAARQGRAAARAARRAGWPGSSRCTARRSTGAGWPLWIDAWSTALRSPEMAEVSRQLDVRWKDTVAAVITAGRRARRDAPATTRRRGLAHHRAARRPRGAGDGARGRAQPPPGHDAGCAARRPPSSASTRRRCARDAASHQPAHRVAGLDERRPVGREGADVAGRRAVERQVGQHPAEGRRELEAVAGAEPEQHRRVAGQRARRRSRGPASGCRGRSPCAPARRAPGSRPRTKPAQQVQGRGVRRRRTGRRPTSRRRRSPGRPSPARRCRPRRRSGSRRTTGRPSRSTPAAGRARSAAGSAGAK